MQQCTLATRNSNSTTPASWSTGKRKLWMRSCELTRKSSLRSKLFHQYRYYSKLESPRATAIVLLPVWPIHASLLLKNTYGCAGTQRSATHSRWTCMPSMLMRPCMKWRRQSRLFPPSNVSATRNLCVARPVADFLQEIVCVLAHLLTPMLKQLHLPAW